ncbi:MAG TPA: adenylyltransferase/cytidyltransferase family protein [Alphaproteobacteria bacterium]|jgi:cytidyltransferase-like protein|nr:adenylyltransferase/cytidyltransferase family protein [Alphaproteobacteria bacterium]
MSPKIKALKELKKIIADIQTRGKKVALITGCFDVLHLGHIDLFRYAKRYADFVIIGLESDISIKLSKGESRPINKIVVRCDQLSEMESVNFIFKLRKSFDFNQKSIDKYHEYLYKKLHPDYVVTNSLADSFWQKKQDRAKKFGIEFLRDVRPRINASSNIINKILEKEL